MAKSGKTRPLRTLVLIAVIAGVVLAIRNSIQDKGGSYTPPQPAAERPEPAAERPQPSAESPEPAAESPEPAAESPEPATDRLGPRPARDYAIDDAGPTADGSIANRLASEFGHTPKHSRET